MKYKHIECGSHSMLYAGTKNGFKKHTRYSNEPIKRTQEPLFNVPIYQKNIHIYNWKELPIDKEVLERLE